MAVLSDNDLAAYMASDDLKVLLPNGERPSLQPSSIDLRLGPVLRVMREREDQEESSRIDPTRPKEMSKLVDDHSDIRRMESDQPFELNPGRFVLGVTAEHISLSKRLAARIEGKSSLARIGVSVHLTAPKVDPGWSNPLTLEINNFGPHVVVMRPYMPIATLIVEQLTSPASESYMAKAIAGFS